MITLVILTMTKKRICQKFKEGYYFWKSKNKIGKKREKKKKEGRGERKGHMEKEKRKGNKRKRRKNSPDIIKF